ncbi:MAG: hypothetical protein IT347_10110 [Candidatus Eisenbacteria bacterium]|nr:hypothetical protein [Candidatus Eisenbacteria bacterium]
MDRLLRRLTLLTVPLAVVLGSTPLPGRAQQPASGRYAFADTTLLRDTLGLVFAGIFPAADSLGLAPDTLRALMIRYRFPLARLLVLSDSLGVPVDSVGVVVDRERFNPLAGGRNRLRDENVFRFTSGWTSTRTTSAWSNNSEYRVRRGPWYANNRTDVNLERYKSVAATTLRQTRDMTSEAGTRLSEQQSFGLWAHTMLYDSYDPNSTSNQKETLNEFKLTARNQRRGKRGSSTDLNLLGGYLYDDKPSIEIKRGLSGRADGRIRTQIGNWFTNDLSGATSTNLARTRRPEAVEELRAIDLATNLAGTTTMFAAKPVGLNLSYALRRTRVDTPTDQNLVNSIRQANESVNGTLRLRRDNDRTLNLIGNAGNSKNQNGRRHDYGGKATLRWSLMGWAVDGNYADARASSDYPRLRGAYGYIERSVNRSADAQFVRGLGPRVQAKLNLAVNLSRYRYEATHDSTTPPTPRDTYRQSYRFEARYNPNVRLTSSTALEVTLNRTINLPRSSTSSNNDTRSYRAEWTWSYQMMTGLTVSQNNQVTADYRFYPFADDRNTLGLNYRTLTTLNTVLTPRLTVMVMHTAQQQPRGSYTRDPDGLEYLKLSDESENLGLHASIRYAPTPSISFSLEPDYRADVRSGTNNGISAKQRDDRRLSMGGNVDLNLQLGRKGTLAGNISRSFDDSRSTSFTNGVPTVSPRAVTDYWSGSLTLTWQL